MWRGSQAHRDHQVLRDFKGCKVHRVLKDLSGRPGLRDRLDQQVQPDQPEPRVLKVPLECRAVPDRKVLRVLRVIRDSRVRRAIKA